MLDRATAEVPGVHRAVHTPRRGLKVRFKAVSNEHPLQQFREVGEEEGRLEAK